MKYILILFLLINFSCKRLKPLPKEEVVFAPFLSTSSLYLKDGSGSLFESIDWYTYDFMGGHIIWSNLDIYALNTGRETFYFQIEDFYDPTKPAGISNPKNFAKFSLNVLRKDGVENIVIDAYACGAAQADPAGYAACQADPERNQFTYFNLETNEFFKQETSKAKARDDWHIAFKDFEIIINNGINGAGRNLAGLAYRNQNFFQLLDDEVIPLLESIKDAKLTGAGKEYFNRVSSNIQYFLPKGHDRVIHESDWYTTNSDGDLVVVNNTWIVKGQEGNSFFKFSVDDIVKSNDEYSVSLAFNYQGPQSFEFDTEQTVINLPLFQNGVKTEYCLDLDTGNYGCESATWDIRFEVTEGGNWYLWTNNGAIPLADNNIALSTNSAL